MLTGKQRAALRTSLQPSQALSLAQARSLEAFVASKEGKAIALVRLPFDEPGLLASLSQRYGPEQVPADVLAKLDFRTAMADLDAVEAAEATAPEPAQTSPFDLSALARWATAASCFALSITKRGGGAFAERVTVGRAQNEDLMLRSRHVSKSHAWFQWDEAGQLHVADFGSRNGTTVAGTPLEPRVLHPVREGDELRIGRLPLLVCSGELFHRLAQQL